MELDQLHVINFMKNIVNKIASTIIIHSTGQMVYKSCDSKKADD